MICMSLQMCIRPVLLETDLAGMWVSAATRSLLHALDGPANLHDLAAELVPENHGSLSRSWAKAVKNR
jgi:hypothetical protein